MKTESNQPIQFRGALTLWLVDDDADCRQMFADGFNRTQSVKCIRQFASAEEVLVALETESAPDLILSDVHMGGMTGVQALTSIKLLAPETQVILFTSLYDSELAQVAFKAGASNFLTKVEAFRNILEFAHVLIRPKSPLPIKGCEPSALVKTAPLGTSNTAPSAATFRGRTQGTFQRLFHLFTPNSKSSSVSYRCQPS